MIPVKKSPTADSRTCDWSTVTQCQLKESSREHIKDVRNALEFFRDGLRTCGAHHDFDKLDDIDGFHKDFSTGFQKRKWFENHLKVNRHHIDKEAGRPEDINLMDVMEHVADCVMAGMARSGSVYELELPNEVLQKAFKNTVDMLKKQVEVHE